MKRNWKTALKIFVSIVGLTIVLRTIRFEEIASAMRAAHVHYLFAALILIVVSLFWRALRWKVLLDGLGATVSYRRLVELYFVGNFFNAFLLSGVGGDVVRAFEAAKDVSAEDATGTVIVDRLSGLLITFALALIALPFNPDALPRTWFLIIVTISVGGFVAAYGLLSGLFYRTAQAILAKAGERSGSTLIQQLDKRVLPLLRTAHRCGWRALLRAFAISAVFGLLLNGWWFLTARAFGLDGVTYFYMFLVTPIMSLALLVPSFSGLGVRELLLPPLMVGAGVSAEAAVTFSLTIFFLQRITSLMGLPIYIFTTLRQKETPETSIR